MSVSTKHTVTEISIKVLEQAAYLFVDESEAESVDTELELGVEVTFRGEKSGNLQLWTAKEVASMIADNLLGEENALEEPHLIARQIDALKEMLNMIAGNLITDLFGDVSVYNLEIPTQIDGNLIQDNIPENATILSVEEFPIVVFLDIEGDHD